MKAHITYEFTDEDRLALGRGEIAPHGILTAFMQEAIREALPAVRKSYYQQMAKEYQEKAEE